MIKLGILSDFTDEERSKLELACEVINLAFRSDEFQRTILNAKFDSTTDSNLMIWTRLNGPIQIQRLYCRRLSWWATHVYGTIALESTDGTVTFNRAFFSRQTVESVANTLLHEACHVAGYHHISKNDAPSVPYLVGRLVEQYLLDTVHQPAPAPVPA